MFRVDFPLPRLFRFSLGLASIALLLIFSAFIGGVSTGTAEASGKHRSISSSRHYSRRGNVSSRRTMRRHRSNRHGYRMHKKRYGHGGVGRHHRKDRRYVSKRSRRDVYSSGVRHGHRKYRRDNRHYSNRRHRDRVVSNRNRSGARVYSNYGSVDIQLNEYPDGWGTTINGVSIHKTCPRNHRCGARLYGDVSGPRIIQLGKDRRGYGVNPTNVGPPNVITYSNEVN